MDTLYTLECIIYVIDSKWSTIRIRINILWTDKKDLSIMPRTNILLMKSQNGAFWWCTTQLQEELERNSCGLQATQTLLIQWQAVTWPGPQTHTGSNIEHAHKKPQNASSVLDTHIQRERKARGLGQLSSIPPGSFMHFTLLMERNNG